MSGHTPGPWWWHDEFTNHVIEVHAEAGKGGIVADVCRTPDPNRDGTANAYLIAAAPDLLAACEAVEWAGTDSIGDPCCPICGGLPDEGGHEPACVLGNAIAKANGAVTSP